LSPSHIPVEPRTILQPYNISPRQQWFLFFNLRSPIACLSLNVEYYFIAWFCELCCTIFFLLIRIYPLELSAFHYTFMDGSGSVGRNLRGEGKGLGYLGKRELLFTWNIERFLEGLDMCQSIRLWIAMQRYLTLLAETHICFSNTAAIKYESHAKLPCHIPLFVLSW
jgi:hypothetical protein